MALNPSTRLNGIFQDASASGGVGNDALRYTAPREPSHTQQQQQQAAAAPAASAVSSSVVFSAMVSLYQYDATARKYVQLGGATAGSKAAVGCVIVGAETSYNLLFYNAAKQHLCTVPIKFGAFKPILQAKSYVNFYDEQGVNWSVKFPSDAQVAEFMRHIFLAKIHVEIWGSEKTVTKTSPNALIQDDLVFVKPDTQQVSSGDTVAVIFSAWRVVGNANSAPGDVMTKYAPFEKAGEGDLRKIRLGDSSERIKALEEGILGMKKGGKRIVLAPPGKTNGQDWYLLEIELVKTKTGHGASQRKSVPAVNTTAPADVEPRATEKKASRRRSSPSAAGGNSSKSSSRSSSAQNLNDRNDAGRNGDLVPYEEEANSVASRNEMELKELRLLQREQQLELQARAIERERMGITGAGGGGFGSMGLGGGFNSGFQNSSSLFNSNGLSGGRPADAMLSELNAKVDYLIRMGSASSSNPNAGVGAGPSDVAAVIRGVERLAGENDRLLTQINSQHQQQSSYEKRCEELLQQNQRLQDEKRTLQERYQSAASSQLNATSELSALSSARDAAVTQTNRLHAEYQQLLTAYYQLQQQQGTSNEAEEHKQALTFEREARARAEKQLSKETQARALAEQELALTKKQHDVALQVKASELSTASTQLEQQVRALQAQLQKANDERRLQASAEEQAQHLVTQSENKEREAKQQLEKVTQQAAQLWQDNQDLTGKLDVSLSRVHELETILDSKTATPEADVESASALAAEERRLFVEQVELLQQKVKDLEQEKFEQVQQALASGRLSSPNSSPRGGQKKGFDSECENCAAAKERVDAAERALAAAEAIKREAQDMLAVAAHTDGGTEERERLVALFKESVNDMFFRFQDLFEEETAVDGKQVLTAIRKVLKSSTKSIIQQLQGPPPQQNETTPESDGNASDGPPAPPPQKADVAQLAEKPAAVGVTDSVATGALQTVDEHDSEEKVTPANDSPHIANGEEKSSAEAKAEVEANATPKEAQPAPVAAAPIPAALQANQYPSSDESESDGDFEA